MGSRATVDADDEIDWEDVNNVDRSHSRKQASLRHLFFKSLRALSVVGKRALFLAGPKIGEDYRAGDSRVSAPH